MSEPKQEDIEKAVDDYLIETFGSREGFLEVIYRRNPALEAKPKELHGIGWAVDRLKEGKRLRFKGQAFPAAHLVIEHGVLIIHNVGQHWKEGELGLSALLSTDWEVVD